jgi:hypothetical protein
MSARYEYSAGQTAVIQRTLLADAVAIVGTGLTVTLELVDRSNGVVPISGDVDWLVAANGTEEYEPDTTDLKVTGSPYRAKWAVTDADGKVAKFPQGEPEVWVIYP